MILELTVDGQTFPIPPHFVSTLRVCPKRILDGLPLEEIEEYVAMRKHESCGGETEYVQTSIGWDVTCKKCGRILARHVIPSKFGQTNEIATNEPIKSSESCESDWNRFCKSAADEAYDGPQFGRY